jgi:hypothetical protein
MDLIEDSLFGLASEESFREGRGSISVAEKERLREGERKEFGEREERCCIGEG